jgi:hypothetical protein
VSIVQDKYRYLSPRFELLHDVVVLSQAWKKAHTYIRRHNWYGDTLELDCSALGLEPLLETWSEEIKNEGYQTLPMRLVPAPKNGAWEFSSEYQGGWGPKSAEDYVLRPLAHVGIRDQTVSTAVMLCLADCIETAQGDPSLKAQEAANAGVHSYGNRLYCRWTKAKRKLPRALFSWGNSDTYSRYFQDYQQFVERPSKIAEAVVRREPKKTVYIVKLDLKAFYDNIDIDRLIVCLHSEYERYRRRHPELPASDKGFWELAQRALSYQWNSSDHSLKGLLRDGVLRQGLPQGLVSSGFFANAYLLDFDRAIGDQLRTNHGLVYQILQLAHITVHDYCRYVDDLRLVVSVDGSHSMESLKNDLTTWVQRCLDASIQVDPESRAKLEVSEKKTEIELFAAAGRQSGVAARMKLLQQQLSGPFDMATLHQVENGLDGLLALAELDFGEDDDSSKGVSELSLASIERPKIEVRDDTLTRFSAYRLTKSLRLRRSMTDLTEQTDGGLAGETLKHEFEVAGRRLVSAWARNPSLVQVLRYGLDIFPDDGLLSPVLDALTKQLDVTEPKQQRVAYYVAAEVLKAGATETGWRAAHDPHFEVGNIHKYRGCLTNFAKEIMTRSDVPWYVLQQAILYLATQGIAANPPQDQDAVTYHAILADYIRGIYPPRRSAPEQAIAVSLVGHQLLGNPKHYLKWFREFAKNWQKEVVAKALEMVGLNNALLYDALTKMPRNGLAAVSKQLPGYLRKDFDGITGNSEANLIDGAWLPLSRVFRYQPNPLSQENGLLQLALALGQLFETKSPDPVVVTPFTIRVRCDNWELINDPSFTGRLLLEIEPSRKDAVDDPRYRAPEWCQGNFAWMYAIGRLLRAAATGELDFTSRQWVLREETGRYTGIRSTWQKRRLGMMHAATAIGGTTTPITPWFSELLLKLLQWPGIVADADLIPEFDGIDSPQRFVRFIEDRLRMQTGIYGKSSGLPIYAYPVEWTLNNEKGFRVALVQGLMPSEDDFTKSEGKLDASGYRARHRNHTASLINLLHRHIQAHDSITGRPHKPYVDLIVFPEYSIHPADQDLIRGLSDATGAMAFYGLLGAKHPTTGVSVNAARWLVPQRRGTRRSWVEVDQGKKYPTQFEEKFGVTSWRPYQVVIELHDPKRKMNPYRIAGAICYDATDISLAADLRDVSHMFVVTAMNRDVKTFDNMVSALRYHMYQHVLIANTGEFGGSTAQAPYQKEHDRLIAHVHGNHQIAISLFDVDLNHFGPELTALRPEIIKTDPDKLQQKKFGKTKPAGLKRKSVKP